MGTATDPTDLGFISHYIPGNNGQLSESQGATGEFDKAGTPQYYDFDYPGGLQQISITATFASGYVFLEPGSNLTGDAQFLTSGVPVTLNVVSANPGKAVFALTGDDHAYAVTVYDKYELPPVCYAAGTQIATKRGSIAVENLKVGDLAVAASGALRPIRWLGHRVTRCAGHPEPASVSPVRILAHAFGPNQPARDLFVSPGHAVCVDVAGEVLIPARALINGLTIRQVEVEEVAYWHIELDSHDVILAEGLPCESYFEMGNRAFFAEATAVALHASPDAPIVTHESFCRPFVDRGPRLDAVRARLAERAEALKGNRLGTRAAARWRDQS